MRSRSIDYAMILLGIMLMMVSSYQLFLPEHASSQNKILGELSNALSVVKTKHALNLDWKDAYSGSEVTENQLIFTNSDASAKVSFTDGGILEIGENSLIRVTSQGEETGLNIERGVFRAKLDGARPLMVEMNGKEYSLSGKNTDIQINLQSERGEIGVISGSLTVTGKDLTEEINPDVLLSVTEDAVKKKNVSYKLTAPSRNEAFFMLGTGLPVTFNWTPAEEAQLYFSSSPEFKNSIPVTAKPGFSMSLKPGIHYWRVETDKGSSLISNFRIMQENPIRIIRPKDGDEISIPAQMERPSDIVLEWQGEASNEYRVEWETEQESRVHVQKGKNAIIQVNGSGEFKWRVRIEDPSRPLALWSEWQNIKVNLIIAPSVPSDLMPDGAEIQTYSQSDEELSLSWSSPQPVVLEIITPAGKKETHSSEANQLTVKASERGLYRWRARGVDAFDRKSEWSSWKSFELLSGESDEGVQRIQLKKPDQLVKFAWEAQEGTEAIFELSRDADFKDVVVRRESLEGVVEIAIPQVGTYFWRSRQVSSDGRVRLGRPVKVIIGPTPPPVKPPKLPDVEIPIEWKLIEKKFSWNVLDFFISRAHADDVKGLITLELPFSDETKSLLVRIYRDKEAQELAYEKMVTGPTFVWDGARAGTYYYQYAIIDHWDRQGPFSDFALLTVTGSEVPLAKKPRLLSPIRAAKVENKNINFSWSESEHAQNFLLQISQDRNFEKIMLERETKLNSARLPILPTEPGLHYWRIKALNKLKQETISNTGRFIILPPLERFVVVDQHTEKKKRWGKRAMISWSPSKDEYKFKDGATAGTISGQALMGVELKGSVFYERWILNGELLRQTGTVFEGESYLFQRLIVDVLKDHNFSNGSRLGWGLGVGQSAGQTYTFDGVSVRSKAASGVSYGPVMKGFHPINNSWEMQSKAFYLLGSIKQIEVGADLMRTWKGDYFFSGGINYAVREYETGSGEQSSIRFSVGMGREF